MASQPRDGGVQGPERRRRLPAVGAAAVDVDLLEQATDAPEFSDGRRVGAADDGAAEGAKADEVGDAEPGGTRDAAELLLLAGRDSNVEALGEIRLPFPTKRHGRPPWRECEKR